MTRMDINNDQEDVGNDQQDVNIDHKNIDNEECRQLLGGCRQSFLHHTVRTLQSRTMHVFHSFHDINLKNNFFTFF